MKKITIRKATEEQIRDNVEKYPKDWGAPVDDLRQWCVVVKKHFGELEGIDYDYLSVEFLAMAVPPLNTKYGVVAYKYTNDFVNIDWDEEIEVIYDN